MARKFRTRKFKIRNQLFGYGKKSRVGLVSQRKIMVNGVKQKPGQRAAKGGSQLRKTVSKRSK